MTRVARRTFIALRRRVRSAIPIHMNDLVAHGTKSARQVSGREWWPTGRKLRCRSEAAEGGGDGWSVPPAAEGMDDERGCETCSLFLSPALRRAVVERHPPQLPSKPSRLSPNSTAWCQWTRCSSPPCLWLANGFPWQLVLH